MNDLKPAARVGNRTRFVLACIVPCMLSAPASAEILLGATRTSAALYGGATYSVDWNGGAAGGTTLNFSTPAPNTRIALTFNAECTVMTAGALRWVGIDIIVNPAGPAGDTVVSPSNSDNALCSGNQTADDIFGAGDGWVSASTQATMVLPQAGNHTVRVRVNGGQSGVARLDDMSLIVQR